MTTMSAEERCDALLSKQNDGESGNKTLAAGAGLHAVGRQYIT
jgi:hypothetical protein